MKGRSGRKWIEKETDFLKENYRKMTHKEMGRKLGRTKNAVRTKCRRLGLKKLTKIVVNKKPTPDLAYVLGVCLGDGSVYKERGKPKYSVSLGVMDKEFAISFRNALENIGLRPSKVSQSNRGDWQVHALGKDFYEWYHTLDHKNLMNILETEKLKREFIRGFYESEGNFYRKGSVWSITICNCDLELLKFVEKLVNRLRFKTKIGSQTYEAHGELHTEYMLHLRGGSREIIRFLREVSPCISRKSLEKVDFSDRRGLMRLNKMWSEQEEEFMQRNYPQEKMAAKRICKILGRSEGSIYGKAYLMGLHKYTVSSS